MLKIQNLIELHCFDAVFFKKILCAQVFETKNAFNFLLKVAEKVSMSSMIRPQTFPIFQKKMYLLKVTLFSSVTIWEREQSA